MTGGGEGPSVIEVVTSFTGGGEGPSVVEVATSFPARLLGAIGELKEFLKSQTKEKEEKESRNSLKIQREVVPSLSARSGFYRLMIA